MTNETPSKEQIITDIIRTFPDSRKLLDYMLEMDNMDGIAFLHGGGDGLVINIRKNPDSEEVVVNPQAVDEMDQPDDLFMPERLQLTIQAHNLIKTILTFMTEKAAKPLLESADESDAFLAGPFQETLGKIADGHSRKERRAAKNIDAAMASYLAFNIGVVDLSNVGTMAWTNDSVSFVHGADQFTVAALRHGLQVCKELKITGTTRLHLKKTLDTYIRKAVENIRRETDEGIKAATQQAAEMDSVDESVAMEGNEENRDVE